MKRLSYLAVVLLIFGVGCTDQLVSSSESGATDTSALEDAEMAATGIVTEEEVAAQYPADLEMEILLPVATDTERASKDGSIFVQVIHNSPSWLAYFVDVYVNGERALNNFRFRTATPFLELPADTNLEIAIAPFWSRNARRAIFKTTYNLPEGNYVLVAGGVLRAWRGARNPDRNVDVSFDLFPAAAPVAGTSDQVAITAFHGSTDAPTVDVVARGVGTLIDDVSFGEFAPVDVSALGLPVGVVPAGDYTLDVTTSDQSATAASFLAPLSGLGGGAAVVLATGYLTPPGFRFGLIAVLPDGTVIRLPSAN